MAATYRLKHCVGEIRFPSNYKIPRKRWEILEKFPVERVGTNEIGVAGEIRSEFCEYVVDLNNARYSIENVANFDLSGRKMGDFLNFVIKNFEVQDIQRLGLRFFVMALKDQFATQADYANLLAKNIDLTKCEPAGITTTGFAVRYSIGSWGLRFGVASSDAEALKRRNHKFNMEPEYSVPSMIYDLDFSRLKVSAGKIVEKGFRAQEFDMHVWIKDAYNSCLDLVKKHFESLGH